MIKEIVAYIIDSGQCYLLCFVVKGEGNVSQLTVSLVSVRHYEVVYLIHEKHAEEVGSVKEKIEG